MDGEAPISAIDIIPNLYDPSYIEQLNAEDKVDDLNYDVYNLVCCDYHTVKVNEENQLESSILDAATRAVQLLVKRIFECPSEPSIVGPLAVLPEPSFILPREKRIPEPKPLTKWEKFAKEKNIKKKKKARMLYDEVTGEYKPRFGYKGINSGIEEHAIVEVKAGQDPFTDPWAEQRKEKKERVTKNLQKQFRNSVRNKDGKISKGSYDPIAVPGIPTELSKKAPKRGREGVKRALELVQHSTASMGRFDEMRKGEPARKIKGKKRAFKDNISDSTLRAEKTNMHSQLRIVTDKVDKKRKGVTNSLAPYEGIIPDAPSDRFRQKKGKGKLRSEDGAGPKKKKPRH